MRLDRINSAKIANSSFFLSPQFKGQKKAILASRGKNYAPTFNKQITTDEFQQKKPKGELSASFGQLGNSVKQTFTKIGFKIEDFIYEVKDNCKQAKVEKRNINGEQRFLRIVDNGEYELYSKECKNLGSMNVGLDTIEQIWCEDDFYKKSAKRGSLSINCLQSNSRGTGSFFIKEAVQKSRDMGLKGRVIVFATTVEPTRGTPVPFYYKKGFKAFKPEIQNKIELGMENLEKYGEYTGPQRTMMYLPKEKIAEYLKPEKPAILEHFKH